MEKNLTATFKSVDDLEHAADELRRQGVLDIRIDAAAPIKVDYQADTLVQTLEAPVMDGSFGLAVCVEKSRYRQAEDTIVKYGGEL